jgi:choline-sulfatase
VPTDLRAPNILLVMADQLIPMLTGAYGHPVVQTPNLNVLAAQGVRFDAAYTPVPVCAPARACMLSGTYASTNRAYDNAALFAADIPTVAHYLTRAGYDCVLSGKMHFVGPDQLHGFQRRLTTDIYPEEFSWVKRRAPWTIARNPELFDPKAGRGNHAQGYVGSGVHVDRWHHHLAYDEEAHFRGREYLRAMGAERRHRPNETPPFFLCVSYHHPHDPFWPPRDLWDLYEGAPIPIPEFPANLEATYSAMDRWQNAQHGVHRYPELRDPDSLRRVRRAYYAMVTYIDRKLGEIVDTLKAQGLWENTVVVFTSDHGDMLCEKGMVQKRSFYDFSSRVPLIIRFPDERYAGTVCQEPVSLIDLPATFMDLAGVPDEQRLPMDGTSLLPLLEAPNSQAGRTVFSEMHVEDVPVPCFMVRRGDYKYVHIHGVDQQLFNLKEDPNEWQNLAGNPVYRQVEAELRGALLERFNPEKIDADIKASLQRRLVIEDAMARNGTRWDYTPPFDANRDALEQYLK